jgi:hypothetical protein
MVGEDVPEDVQAGAVGQVDVEQHGVELRQIGLAGLLARGGYQDVHGMEMVVKRVSDSLCVIHVVLYQEDSRPRFVDGLLFCHGGFPGELLLSFAAAVSLQ